MENYNTEYKKLIREELQHLLDLQAENGDSELDAYRNLGYILGIKYRCEDEKY